MGTPSNKNAADEERPEWSLAADLRVRATIEGLGMRTLLVALTVTTMATTALAETLRYEAYALPANAERKLLQKGTVDYSPAKDVQVIDAATPGRPYHWAKRLLLFGPYELEADVYRESSLDGFGLVINDPDHPDGFSWNWFDRESRDVFVKRKGSGHLRVSVRHVNDLVELEAVEFLDDIILRYKDNITRQEPGEHTHEFVIFKGSVFRLPGQAP